MRFNEFFDAKISPKRTRAARTVVVDADSNLLSNVNEKAVEAIDYDGGDWATSRAA